MLKEYEIKYHKLEKEQFWFKAIRKLILQLIGDNKEQLVILDIGCSGGVLLDELRENGFNDIYGIDLSEDGINICQYNRHKNTYVMDAAKTEFKDNMFDLIIASNVLEHIENDEDALKEWNRILKKDGLLIVIVPAFKFLWSEHDIVNAHFRRYRKNELETKIRKNFELIKISYWNFILFFPVFAVRMVQLLIKPKPTLTGDLIDFNPILNKCLYSILWTENKLLKFIVLPVGISLFTVVKSKK